MSVPVFVIGALLFGKALVLLVAGIAFYFVLFFCGTMIRTRKPADRFPAGLYWFGCILSAGLLLQWFAWIYEWTLHAYEFARVMLY